MGVLRKPSNDLVANRAFGKVLGSKFHFGTDWGFGSGTAVYAMADGVVDQVFELADYGKIVRINHGSLISVSTRTRYCHLFSQDVHYGDQVLRGQRIGTMGSTGSLTSLVHLHSELILDGVRRDEQPYQTGSGVSGSGDITTIPQEEENMPYLIYNPSTSSHPIRRAWYVCGIKFEILTEARAVVKAKTMKQLLRLSSSVPDADVTTEFTDEMWDEAITDVLTSSGGSGGLTTAQDAKLTAIPSGDSDLVDEAELGGALTAAVNLINAHTDAKFDGLTLTTP